MEGRNNGLSVSRRGGGGYRICMYGIHKIERRSKTK